MTDTTHEAPARAYMLPSFAAGLEKQPQYGSTVEYILKSRSDDLVQAAVAAKLTEAAESLHTFVERRGPNDYRRGHRGYSNGIDACYDAILALITPDAQAALDRVVAAERERCARVAEQKAGAGSHAIAAAIREGRE
jgi:hypothetical protein